MCRLPLANTNIHCDTILIGHYLPRDFLLNSFVVFGIRSLAKCHTPSSSSSTSLCVAVIMEQCLTIIKLKTCSSAPFSISKCFILFVWLMGRTTLHSFVLFLSRVLSASLSLSFEIFIYCTSVFFLQIWIDKCILSNTNCGSFRRGFGHSIGRYARVQKKYS